jgi:DNA mismatch repair protein MutL
MITLLDKSVYELIAAGETITRPSDIIKELAENAVDSGASNITIEFSSGGARLIRVSDDGGGIPFDEIPTAFLRHATGKVSVVSDLENINTFGFRGEALASVAAVSKAEIITKPHAEEYGGRFGIQGGETVAYENVAAKNGTVITVRDLFYNIPARLKFLKSNTSEGNACQAAADKIILAHPEISFKVIRDGQLTRVTNGDNDPFTAIYAVFGKEFADGLLPVNYERNGIHVTGFITKPLSGKHNRAYQYFFVNRRPVRSFALLGALEDGYKNMIMTGRFPGCILFVEMPPNRFDINISPTKTEVRFAEEFQVRDAVYCAVKDALTPHNNYTPQPNYQEYRPQPTQPVQTIPPPEYLRNLPSYPDPISQSQSQPQLQRDFEYTGALFPKASTSAYDDLNFTDKVITAPEPTTRIIGELFSTYILAEHTRYDDGVKKTYVMIDKHAAHERIKFNRLQRELRLSSQLLPDKTDYRLGAEAARILLGKGDTLLENGFEVMESELGEEYIAVLSFPDIIPLSSAEQFLAEIAAAATQEMSGNAVFDDILHTIACKAAVKARDISPPEDLHNLVNIVLTDDTVRYCPHGRPVLVTFSEYDVGRLFKRV